MSAELLAHFALADTGNDEAGEWIYLSDADVLEGELDRGWPNRVRHAAADSNGPAIELEIGGNGVPCGVGCTRLRVRLPISLKDLPYGGRQVVQAYEPRFDETGALVAAAGLERRWFEHVDGDTHLIVEVLLQPWGGLPAKLEDPYVEPWTFGQGSFGHRCRLCLADDYAGPLVHKPDCPAKEIA